MNHHRDRTREEFTRQAALFVAAPEMKDEEALRALVELAQAGPGDAALDVACGPGIVVCAFAEVVARATGIDLTPAMIHQARLLQRDKELANVSWQVGDVHHLPFADHSFSIVTSRYAFHHIEEPAMVLSEMARVLSPGGRLVLVDVIASETARQAEAFNRMERFRDPSHVRAMPLTELERLLSDAGLEVAATSFYRLDFEVERLVEGSFPEDGDRDRLRRTYEDAVENDTLGINTRLVDGKLLCSYPIAMLLARPGK